MKKSKRKLAQYGLGGPVDPTKPKATPQEIAAANELAKNFARRRNMIAPEEAHVGDTLPLVTFNGVGIPYGAPLPPTVTSKKYQPVPREATAFEYDDAQKLAWYRDPHTDDLVEMDPVNIHLPQFKKKAFAGGGVAGYNLATQGVQLLEALSPLMEGQQFSKQPIYNPNTMRGMVSPYATGGVAIEAEGEEVIQTPDGTMGQLQGPSHEEGGIEMTVPEGTKIYSDRLAIDGKTMQQRKLSRERRLKKLDKLMEGKSMDKLARNTYEREKEVIETEEAQDMAVQQAIHQAVGQEGEAAYGMGPGNPYMIDYLGTALELPTEAIPLQPVGTPNYLQNRPIAGSPISSEVKGQMAITAQGDTPEVAPDNLGDTIGMIGTGIGAVAPLVTTLLNRRNTKPNINRYLGFGQDALDTNQAAIDALETTRSGTNTNIDSGAAAAVARNNNSATSVNTARALNIATELGKNKAKQEVDNSFSRSLTGLLENRASLHNAQDDKEMFGATKRDEADQMDNDNFYSSLAENLSNFGTGVQQMGRNLNIRKSNRVNTNLLGQLSQYGLTFDEQGNLISK
jgi:hypothetical protein